MLGWPFRSSTSTPVDINAVVAELLRDLAFAQTSNQKMFGYKRAVAAVLSLDESLKDLVRPDRTLEKIPSVGPASTRVILEVLETGGSPTVEDAVATSAKRADIERRRNATLACPHAKLRSPDDQTDRLLRAVEQPHVRILAHPRGRIAGSRAGVVADWPVVFAAAARAGVAVEINGDPARQDLDYTLAIDALAAGCLFALDSDAHTTFQLRYSDIALAHARLAGIPRDRIVNCWPAERLLGWLAGQRSNASAATSSP